jgi:hypothetical protein
MKRLLQEVTPWPQARTNLGDELDVLKIIGEIRKWKAPSKHPKK